eukprot:scaffold169360_cov32-Tisochrysis_lutea.AAC.3
MPSDDFWTVADGGGLSADHPPARPGVCGVGEERECGSGEGGGAGAVRGPSTPIPIVLTS